MMFNRLLVVSEVFIHNTGFQSVSRSFDAIIGQYSKHFDRIDVVGPGSVEILCRQSPGKNIYYSSTPLYSKKIMRRINYLVSAKRAGHFFDRVCRLANPDIVQIRIPSIFSLRAYHYFKNKNVALTSYISGEWYSSFKANYGFPFSSVAGRLLEFSQRQIIKNTVAVSAGPQIRDNYAHLNEVYPYFSTTHNEIFPPPLRVQNEISFLSVGRLEGLKRIEDALYALRLIKDQGVNFHYHICGDGVKSRELSTLVQELGLSDNVTFYGYIRDLSRLMSIYKECDILLFPSVSEGTPKVLPEAMSFGVIPIAVRSTGSIKFIIDNEKNGLLVDARSPESIANACIRLVENNNLRLTIQQNCLEYASSHTLSKEVNGLWNYVLNHKDILRVT